MWYCELIKFGFRYDFKTMYEAVNYGKKSGFEYIVYKENV